MKVDLLSLAADRRAGRVQGITSVCSAHPLVLEAACREALRDPSNRQTVAEIAYRFGFGDQASTSSHLIPKSMLAENGLKAGENYQEHFVGAHDAVAIAVQNGHAQAGGLSKPIFESLVQRGIIDAFKNQPSALSEAEQEEALAQFKLVLDEVKASAQAILYALEHPAGWKVVGHDDDGALVADSQALYANPVGYYQRANLLPAVKSNQTLRDKFFGAVVFERGQVVSPKATRDSVFLSNFASSVVVE